MEAVVRVADVMDVASAAEAIARSVVIPVASINEVKSCNYSIKMIYVIILLQYVIYYFYHTAYGSEKYSIAR